MDITLPGHRVMDGPGPGTGRARLDLDRRPAETWTAIAYGKYDAVFSKDGYQSAQQQADPNYPPGISYVPLPSASYSCPSPVRHAPCAGLL
jgi:hypothetical protein